MMNRIVITTLAATAAIQAFICTVVGWALPAIHRSVFWSASTKLSEVRELMPMVSRVVSDYFGVIPALFILAVLGSSLALFRFPDRPVQCMVISLCAQLATTWMLFFCFCYIGFLGMISLGREPCFELESFIEFGCGVFPITFILILIPAVFAIKSCGAIRAIHKQEDEQEFPE